MSKPLPLHPADLRGASRLAIDGILGLSSVVETLHHAIASRAGLVGKVVPGPTRGITGFSYRSVRWVTERVGRVLDTALANLVPQFDVRQPSSRREAVLAAVNGVLGDHLADTGNPLAIPMGFRIDGHPLSLETGALAGIAQPGGKLLIMVHGLCMNDLQWTRPQGKQAAAVTSSYPPATMLAQDIGCTPLYLHYNSGRHISHNGRDFADLLETLVDAWPEAVTEITLLGHSMGGLVCRSALYYGAQARHRWPRRVKNLVCLGTPHLGAPLERGGNRFELALGISPYTAPFARLGKIRSAGITDMRHGNLRDEDWQGQDRFAHSNERPSPLPLPKGMRCYAIAATTGKRRGDLGDRMLGDGLVPVDSALGHHADPPFDLALPASRQWVAYGMNHFELLYHPTVYDRLGRWLAPTSRRSASSGS